MIEEFLNFPKHVSIQTTSLCNASCVFCPYPEVKKLFPKKVMDEDLFLKIIAECGRHKEIEMINLFMNNEPLTDPRIAERIKYATRKVPWAAVCLMTNGSLLTDERINSLKKTKLDSISISFHGIRKDTVENAMGIPYEITLRRINNFIKAVEKRMALEGFFGINFLRHKYLSDEEKEEAIRYWRRRGIQKVDFYAGPVSRVGNVRGLPRIHHKGKVVGCLSVVEDEMININEDGTVTLCCMDWRREVILGDLNRESMAEIWNGRRKEVWQMINGHTDMPDGFLCRRCEEAAVSTPDDTKGENPDIALVLLPPTRNEGLADWIMAFAARLNAQKTTTLLLNLDAELRHRISEKQELFWSGSAPGGCDFKEESRTWLNKQGVREVLNHCVQSLLSIHANVLAFPVGTVNQRFTLEVARKIKMLVPDTKIMLLDRDCRMHAKAALRPGTPVDLLLAGQEVQVARVVDFLKAES